MISSLSIKDVASYDSTNGVQLNDLKKVNFFFGCNGSGKSTIVNYFRNLSLDTTIQNPLFESCSSRGYDSTHHQILTYDEQFVEENFKRSNEFKGVFSLNQSNAAIDQQISNEETNIISFESLRDKYIQKSETLELDRKSKNDALLDYCWNQRASFTSFSKITLPHSGSKPNHLREIKKILQNPIRQVLDIQSLADQYRILYEQDLFEITEEIDSKLYHEIRKLEIKLHKLLQNIIIGNEEVDIAGLIKTINSRNWVEQGVKFLEQTKNICPFCQNATINSLLKEQFEKFFDRTYKNKIAEIEGLLELYQKKTSSFVLNISAIQSVFNPDNNVSDLVIALKSLFDQNIETIKYKIQHSNERKSIISLNSMKVQLSKIIRLIKNNNQVYKDIDSNKSALVKEIWNHIADHCRHIIQDNDDRVAKYSRIDILCDELKERYIGKINAAKQNIEILRSQTVNTKDAVDSINITLKNSGFEGFEIDEKEVVNNISRYYLKRSQSTSTNPVFDTLSEGEKNFISFLYFYQLCLGTDDLQNSGNKKKIIVIDDPVSSLDSQSLFIISTLIHSLTERKANDSRPNRMELRNTSIAQVFLFTHNIYFYKEVTFIKRPICTDYWHFKLSKQNNQTIISGSYNSSIFDDYTMMWKTIKEIKSSIPQNSSQNIMISNTMRRIIESYVNFVGYGNDSWASLLGTNQNDTTYYIKCAFISTINDESHRVSALDSAYYQKIIHEQPQILFNVFTSIFSAIGKEHYELMMEEQIN